MGEIRRLYLEWLLICGLAIAPGLAKASDCVVYNIDSDKGAAMFEEASGMDNAAIYRNVPRKWIPHDPRTGKQYPGEWRAVCREVAAYVMPEPVHCVLWNNDTDDMVCQYGDSWKQATGQWTAHGEWEEYGDPCASYNAAIKRGDSMPNEPSCTGLDNPKPIVIPKGKEWKA